MNKRILNLAIPNIITNLTVPLLSIVDTALVGHLEGIFYLGAIAIGGMIFNFIYWGFGFLRMGTTGLTAQELGNNNQEEIISILLRALFFAIIASFFLFIIKDKILDLSFIFISTTSEVEKYAREYFNIRIYSAPATLCIYVFTGWFLGLQKAKYPLILAVLVNVFNIIFNLLFLKVFLLKSDGVALGTVIAQYLGLITAITIYLISYKKYNKYIKLKTILSLKKLKQFFMINRDIFIRTMCLVFTFSFFTTKSADFGEKVLAANTILLQLWTLMAYGIDGFAYAAESLIGMYFGEKNILKIKESIKYLFKWGLGTAIVTSFTYFIFMKQILEIFTDKTDLIELAISFSIWTIIAPLTNFWCFIWDGIFIGATKTVAMRNSMIFSLFIVFLPTYYLTKSYIGNNALWLAMILFMVSRNFTLARYYKLKFFKE